MDTLRAAAMEVHLEASFDSSQALLEASVEIAEERGFPSPSKPRRRPSEPLAEESSSAAAPLDVVAVRERREDAPRRATVAAPALAEEIMLQVATEQPVVYPKASDPASLDATVLTKSASVPHRQHSSTSPSRSRKERIAAPMDFRMSAEQKRNNYFRTLSSTLNRRAELERSFKARDDGTSIVRASRVSKLLAKSDLNSRSMTSEASTTAGLPFFRSSTEETLFRHMKQISIAKPSAVSASTSSNSTKLLRSSVNRLSKPKPKAPVVSKEYTLFDEQINCTFKPKVKRRSSDDYAGDEEKTDTFIERQEAVERSRQAELESSVGRAKYDALVDKKVCPICGSNQTYDEVKDKRKQCSICRRDYVYKVDWSRVSRKFFTRINEFSHQQEETRKKILAEILSEMKYKRKEFDAKSHVVVEREVDPFEKIVWTKKREMGFFERLDEFLLTKKGNISVIDQEAYGKVCTFKPTLVKSGLGSEEDGASAFSAFLERYEADLERRMQIRSEQDAKKAEVEERFGRK